MIYVKDEYSSYLDKISDNIDFFIWVNLFCIFLLVLSIFCGMMYNWILGGIILLFVIFYQFYMWVKLSRITYKISLTDYGIRGDRIYLSSKFNKNISSGHSDEFYVVYSDLQGYKILDNKNLKLINTNKSNMDDLNYLFSNIALEKLELIEKTFEKFGVSKLD